MLVAELIRRKRDGLELSADEITSLVNGIADGTVTDAFLGSSKAKYRALCLCQEWRSESMTYSARYLPVVSYSSAV